MTLRDRLVLTAVVVLAVIGAAWALVVSPERKQAKEATAELTTAKSQLSGAEGQLASAREAQGRYASAYASIVSIGKAVPTSQEVPALIYQLAQASSQKDVQFASITTGASATGASASSSSSSSATAGAAAAGFSQLPFTFVFDGSYFGLEHMLRDLSDLATRGPEGKLDVSGRLLTIDSVKLAPNNEQGGAKPGSSTLSATVTASAYELPPEAAQPSAAAPAGSASASSASAPSTPTAPATVKVNP